jgi:hypothetical protein
MMETGLGARLGLAFTLECRDKDGNILKTIDCKGSIPLSQLGIDVDQAKELITEATNGADSSK